MTGFSRYTKVYLLKNQQFNVMSPYKSSIHVVSGKLQAGTQHGGFKVQMIFLVQRGDVQAPA